MRKRQANEDFLMQALVITFEGDHMAVCECGCFLGPSGNLCCRKCWVTGRERRRDPGADGEDDDDDEAEVKGFDFVQGKR